MYEWAKVKKFCETRLPPIKSSYVNPLRNWVRGLNPIRYSIMQEQTRAAFCGLGGGVAWWRGVAKQPQQKNSFFYSFLNLTMQGQPWRHDVGVEGAWLGGGAWQSSLSKNIQFFIYIFKCNNARANWGGMTWAWRGRNLVEGRGKAASATKSNFLNFF